MICRAQSEPGFIFNIAADLSELYWEGLYALLQAALGGHHQHHRGGHHQHHHQHQHLSAEEWILVHSSCKLHEEKVITIMVPLHWVGFLCTPESLRTEHQHFFAFR